MSKTVAVYPIVAALLKAYKVGGALTPWYAVNSAQERFLTNGSKWESELSHLTAEELETIASYDAAELNAWLASKGFEITLEPFEGPDDFGTASVMRVLVKWITAGEETTITKDGKKYRAAKLTDDVTYTTVEGYAHPIAHVHTESGDTVHMTLADGPILEGLDLLEKVMSLTDGKRSFGYDDLIFPFIDHNSEVDISFFVDMFFKGKRRSGPIDNCRVKAAKQQTKFQMNHLGAKAESAVAIAMSFECFSMPKPSMILNDTFYVWMTRKGMSAPYFAGVIDDSDWKDPGSLDAENKSKMQALPIA